MGGPIRCPFLPGNRNLRLTYTIGNSSHYQAMTKVLLYPYGHVKVANYLYYKKH
jgi:hypothetical protein